MVGVETVFQILLESAVWNSQTRVEYSENLQMYDVHGNATDKAFFRYFMDVTSKENIYKMHIQDRKVLVNFEFNSRYKRQTLALDLGFKVRVYCKGASELVLDLCSNFISQDGKVVSLDETSKKLDF